MWHAIGYPVGVTESSYVRQPMMWWRLQILGPNYSLFYTCLPALLVVCLKNRPHWKHTTTRRTVQSARAATHYLEFARWFCLSSRKPFSHWLLELRDLLPFCPALYCTLEATVPVCMQAILTYRYYIHDGADSFCCCRGLLKAEKPMAGLHCQNSSSYGSPQLACMVQTP